MPPSSQDEPFQPRSSAELVAESAYSSAMAEEALDAAVRATVEFADADQKVTPEEIDALREVVRRLGAIPLAFEPVAVQLIEAIVQVNYGQLAREPEVWQAASQKIARLLFDSPVSRARLDVLWRQLVESTS